MPKPQCKTLPSNHVYHQLFKNKITYVDLGWRKFTIHLADKLEDLSGVEADGLTDFSNYKIVLHKNLSDVRARETLLHEILHCLFDTFDIDERSDTTIKITNEQLTSMTTRGLLLIKNLNPVLWGLLY